MEIGLGLDGTLGLSLADEAELSAEAARLGYASIWTPEGSGYDSFQVCAHRWAASRAVVADGLGTGISVSPVALRTPIGLAMSAGTMTAVTGGRFVLGIGSGALHRPAGRRTFGMGPGSTLDVMRDYVGTVRRLLAGETVTHTGPAASLHGVSLAIDPPPRTPVYLGALGPKMLELGGEVADGLALNWCTPEQVAWSRERIAAGAAAAGRDPAAVKVAEYIRICVDDDVDAARRALARAALGYALGPRGSTVRDRRMGYRAHFERMGFTDALRELDEMRSNGSSREEVADAFPAELLLQVGYFGTPDGAAAHFRALAEGLDIAMVRVVAAQPGVDSTLAALRACRPELLG
jgi:alkanesulfonate monooxygenase SsuD/methylene tetrahydromethanopterin reductase-like flavin-dependent oxidoreductase (luciferase family)